MRLNLVVNCVTVWNTNEPCCDPIDRAHFAVHGQGRRHKAIKFAGSVCGYCRQHNLSKRSVQLERFGDGKRWRLFLMDSSFNDRHSNSRRTAWKNTKRASINCCATRRHTASNTRVTAMAESDGYIFFGGGHRHYNGGRTSTFILDADNYNCGITAAGVQRRMTAVGIKTAELHRRKYIDTLTTAEVQRRKYSGGWSHTWSTVFFFFGGGRRHYGRNYIGGSRLTD